MVSLLQHQDTAHPWFPSRLGSPLTCFPIAARPGPTAMSPMDRRPRPTRVRGLQSPSLVQRRSADESEQAPCRRRSCREPPNASRPSAPPPWASLSSTPAAEGLGVAALGLPELNTRGRGFGMLPPHGHTYSGVIHGVGGERRLALLDV
jgi:hypothetical protein